MIFNQNLNRLLEVRIVKEFQHHHSMQGKLRKDSNDASFILYKMPFVVEFHDALIENYLEVSLSDLNCKLMLDGSSAVACCLQMELLNLDLMRLETFDNHPQTDIFLSEGILKMDNLHSNLEAIDKLLPLIEAKSGSQSR